MKKASCFILALFFCAGVFTRVQAQITNPMLITAGLDDLWGQCSVPANKMDTGVDFLIALSTEIAAYGLSRNPAITPPRVVMTIAINPGQCDLRGWEGDNNNQAKLQALFDLGYQLTSHGNTHCSFPPGFMGDISASDLIVEDKGAVDWMRNRITGCHLGFAFRHGGNTCSTCTIGKWSPNCSILARDINCWPHGWGMSLEYDNANWGNHIGVTSHETDRWPVEISLDGFTYWYNGGGYFTVPRISLDTNLNNWINAFNAAYNSGENPRSAVSVFFHDYDVTKATSFDRATAEARRQTIRQFFKRVLVDDNKRYVSTGTYENVYCVTFSQYREYYWLMNNLPEKNYSSFEEILAAGNMQKCKYSVEPSTSIQAESMARKSGGSSVTGGWKLAASGDFVADTVNFPDEHCMYAIDIVAKATQGSDSNWPVAQVKMSAMPERLVKLSTDEDIYFSEVGTAVINSASWATYNVYVTFPVTLPDRKLYALANAVVFKLKNAGSGKELDIDKVTVRRVSKKFVQGIDGYTGGDSKYADNTGAITSTGEDLNSNGADWKIYLKYDISSIPSGKVITRAVLTLFARTSWNWQARQALEAYGTNNNWTAPAVSGSVLDTKNMIFPGTWLDFDITSLAQTAVSGGSGTLMAGIKNTSATGASWFLASSRYTLDPKVRPALKITYAEVADTTVPGAPAAVRDGTSATADSSFTNSTTQLSANWDAATDNESGIARYYYAIGTAPGGTNILNWTDTGMARSVTKTGLALTVGATYYFSLKAENGLTLQGTAANSDGQFITAGGSDTTPPSSPAAVRDGTASDIDSTELTTQLSANWDASTDTDSGVTKYYYAIGTTPGGTDITDWTDNGPALAVTKTGLTLNLNQAYYFSVKAENGVSLQSDLTSSNGQTVTGQDGVTATPIYPNPYSLSRHGGMKFRVSANAGGELKIYTMSGKLVTTVTADSGAGFIIWDGRNAEGDKVAKGIYVYKITGGNGDTSTGKIAVLK